MAKVPLIQPEELQQRLTSPNPPYILDVREPAEYQRANLGGHLIPLGELPRRLGELDRNREIVVHCLSGSRSEMAAQVMLASGFKHVHNLAGGLRAWAAKVDPSMKL